MTLIHAIGRDLSNSEIVHLAVNFTGLNKGIRFYEKRISRPLIVVIIKSEQDLSEFQDSTQKLKMSYPLWIVFFIGTVNDDICQFCQNPSGNVFRLQFQSEFNVFCCNQVNLDEWWSEDDYTIDVRSMGEIINGTIEWKHNDLSVFRRRNRVGHRSIRVALIEDPIFSSFNGTHYFGLLGELFVEFAESVHFNILPPILEKLHGRSSHVNSGWTGVIERIRSGEADLGIDTYTITEKRLNIIDFTIPLFNKKTLLYVRKPDSTDISWSAYTEAFEVENWVAILAVIIISSIVLTAMKSKARKDTLLCKITENFLDVWGIFCQQGLTGEFPLEKSLRIVYLTILLAAMVVSAVYSGSLISFLTTPKVKIPFRSMKEFAEQTDYELIVMKDSAYYDLFSESDEPVLKKMFSRMRPYDDLPANDTEGFRQICKEKVAFYTNEGFLQGREVNVSCEVLHVETGQIESLAMILPKDSQYTKLLDYYLLQLRDHGMLNQLTEKYLSKSITISRKENEVELTAIIPILVVLGGGILLSLLILFIERIFFVIFGSKSSLTFNSRSENFRYNSGYLSQSKNRKSTILKPSVRKSVLIMDYCP